MSNNSEAKSILLLERKLARLELALTECELLLENRSRELYFQVEETKKALSKAEVESTHARDAEQFASSILQSVSDVIIVTTLTGEIIQVNEAIEPLLGFSVEELVGKKIESIVPETFRTDHPAKMKRAAQTINRTNISESKSLNFAMQRQLSALHKSGIHVPVEITVTTVQHKSSYHFVGVLRDCRERIAVENALNTIANTDSLTQLANRRKLESVFNEVLLQSRQSPQKNDVIALFLLDLDGFKPVNDQYGHDAGDEVLMTIANRLQEVTRDADVTARLGGDEFVVLTKLKQDRKVIEHISERIRQAVDEPIMFKGHHLKVSASIGVCLHRNNETLEKLLHGADKAMYQSKLNGKNGWSLYSDDSV